MNRIGTLAMAIIMAAAVSACGYSPEELQNQKTVIDSKLPDGCEFQYYGEFGGMRVGAIVCDGKVQPSTVSYWTSRSGKSTLHHYEMVAQITI